MRPVYVLDSRAYAGLAILQRPPFCGHGCTNLDARLSTNITDSACSLRFVNRTVTMRLGGPPIQLDLAFRSPNGIESNGANHGNNTRSFHRAYAGPNRSRARATLELARANPEGKACRRTSHQDAGVPSTRPSRARNSGRIDQQTSSGMSIVGSWQGEPME